MIQPELLIKPTTFKESTYGSYRFYEVVQYVMNWGGEVLSENQFGLSPHWKTHKICFGKRTGTNSVNKLEIYGYFHLSFLQAFKKFLDENFPAYESGKIPLLFHRFTSIVGQIRNGKLEECSANDFGYAQEYCRVHEHRRDKYLLRIYRLVKPKEAGHFKFEITFMRDEKSPRSAKRSNIKNKANAMFELLRKVEKGFQPIQIEKDFS